MTLDLDCNVSLRVTDGLSGMEKLIDVARCVSGQQRMKIKVAFDDLALALGPLVDQTDHGAWFDDLKARMRAIKA